PTNRQMADKHHKVARAKEEVVRSTIEARRLRRWVDQEDTIYRRAIAQLTSCDPLLAAELSWVYARQLRVNNVHRARLRKLYALPDFGYSYALDTDMDTASPMDHTRSVGDDVGGNQGEDGTGLIDGIDEDDSLNDEALRLGNFMERLHD
ncbi:hypothetical protein HDZ31DRAFT_46294, partial [Schizophyllum fasciatum]